MHKNLSDLISGDSIVDFYVLKNYIKQNKATGEEYFRCELGDATSAIQAICWEDPNNFDITIDSIGSIVKIKGTASEYKRALQLRIFKIRQANDSDLQSLDLNCIIKSAPIDMHDCENEIKKMIESINDEDYKHLCNVILQEKRDCFFSYPAGKVVHHSFRGGLAMHTCNMMKLAKSVAELYPNIINKDLLMCATFLHDIAKIEEFDVTQASCVKDYSLKGQLAGHIYLGAKYVTNKCSELNIDEYKTTLLEHMILSHHGEEEKGSPIKPKIPEAEALHLIDVMDSRLEIYAEELDNIKIGQFSQKQNWALEHRIYHHE